MEIKTKFDVGQEVWPIVYEWADMDTHLAIVDDCSVVASGTIKFDHAGHRESYGLVNGAHASDLFATKALAQAECDRRNGEGE